jgi:hypothetical protein
VVTYTTVVISEGDLPKVLNKPEDVYITEDNICVLGIGRGVSIHISPSDAAVLGDWLKACSEIGLAREEVNQ